MDTNLKSIETVLKKAQCPEDVFGKDATPDDVKEKFRWMSKTTHPDLHQNPVDRKLAEELFKEQGKWLALAEKKFADGTYGNDKVIEAVTIKTKLHTVVLGELLASGDLCEVYAGVADKGIQVVAKIPRSPANNDLMKVEADQLLFLRDKGEAKDTKGMDYIPTLMESFEMQDGKVKKRVNIIHRVTDSFTLAQVAAAYPKGLDFRDAAWMWNRMLGALTACHQSGVIHVAVTPDNFLICPANHHGSLVDWCYSLKDDTAPKVISNKWKSFYPPEMFKRFPVSCGTDIYMAAQCLKFVCKDIPKPVLNLVNACLLGSAYRTYNSWQLFSDFRDVLKDLYGAPKFRHFEMPENKTKTTTK